jgi:hypothetical protein
MKTLLLTLTILLAGAIVTPASAQSFHGKKMQAAAKKQKKYHRGLLFKVKQSATYRRKRKNALHK